MARDRTSCRVATWMDSLWEKLSPQQLGFDAKIDRLRLLFGNVVWLNLKEVMVFCSIRRSDICRI